jgi:PAS domain S-box-containing protein
VGNRLGAAAPEDSVGRALSNIDRFIPLVDSLTVPASLHRPDGRFVHMNAAAERASGLSNVQLVARDVTYLIPEADRRHVEAQFRRAVQTGQPTDFGTSFVDAGGHPRGSRAQQLPLEEGGEVVAVLILAWEAELLTTQSRRQPEELTPRQLQVLRLLASGHSTLEIAEHLALTPQTVRNHVRDVLAQLDAHNRMAAIVRAQHAGLLAPRPLEPTPGTR